MNRIYIVDDEPDMVELLATVLKGEGFEVETYTDGRAALARVLEEPPELLLLDLMMPDLDGFELLKLLRLDARGRDVVVLVVSARTGHRAQLETLQLGANAYIYKPFSPRELVAQVRQLLVERGGPKGE
ncbi:MAG: response regulator [Thermoanaerobaculales bacterium]|nr:response regulator [Thermoanaerobaculales bacterium]